MPSLIAENNVGILIKAEADTGAITATTLQLDEMGKTASTSAAKTAEASSNWTTSFKKAGSVATELGHSLSTYVTAPLALIAGESVKSAMSFQQTMELLHTNAGTAQSAIAGLSNEVLKMAGDVGAKPEELAQGLYHIASAGNGIWSTAKQLDILKIAAEGAAVGQANLDDTTYSLTSTMASNIKGAQNAAETMGTLTSIVGAGDMKMQDLNAAIGTGFLGTAASFGISLSSVGAALATLTDNGEHADAAATRLRMTWALMASPSKQASKMLEDLGLTADGAAQATDQMNHVFSETGLSTTKLAVDLQQPNGMNVALKDLQTHLHKAGLNAAETDAILAKAFGGGRTDAAMLTMLQNLDRTDEKFKMINDSAGSFSDKWAAQQQTANQKFHDAWASITADLTRLGTTIMPSVIKLMGDVRNVIDDISKSFQNLSPKQQQFAIEAAAIAAIIGPALLIFGSFAKSLLAIHEAWIIVAPVFGLLRAALLGIGGAFIDLQVAIGPVGWIIEGILLVVAVAAYEVYKHWSSVVKWIREGVDEIKKIWDRSIGDVENWNNNILGFFMRLPKNIGHAIEDIGKFIKQIPKYLAEGLTGMLNYDVAKIIDWSKAVDEWGKTIINWFKNEPKEIEKTFEKWGDAVEGWFKKEPTKIKQNLDSWNKAIETWFKNEPKEIEKRLEEWGKTIENWFKSIPTRIKKQFEEWWHTIDQWFKDLPNQLKETLDGSGKDLAKRHTDGFKTFWKDSKRVGEIAAIILACIVAAVLIVAVTIVIKAIELGIKIIEGVARGISDTIGALVSAMAAIARTVTKAVEGAGNWLYNAGRDIIMGLVHGMESVVGKVSSTLKNVGKDVEGDIKGALHSAHIPGFASGTNYAGGGWSMVGENGPEAMYVPQGAQIKTNSQTTHSQTTNNNRQTTIQNLVIQTPQVDGNFFKKLDHDVFLSSRGLTTNRGIR